MFVDCASCGMLLLLRVYPSMLCWLLISLAADLIKHACALITRLLGPCVAMRTLNDAGRVTKFLAPGCCCCCCRLQAPRRWFEDPRCSQRLN